MGPLGMVKRRQGFSNRRRGVGDQKRFFSGCTGRQTNRTPAGIHAAPRKRQAEEEMGTWGEGTGVNKEEARCCPLLSPSSSGWVQ